MQTKINYAMHGNAGHCDYSSQRYGPLKSFTRANASRGLLNEYNGKPDEKRGSD